MNGCSFEQLVRLLDGQLDGDCRLAVSDHLRACRICRDAIRSISRDRRELAHSDHPMLRQMKSLWQYRKSSTVHPSDRY